MQRNAEKFYIWYKYKIPNRTEKKNIINKLSSAEDLLRKVFCWAQGLVWSHKYICHVMSNLVISYVILWPRYCQKIAKILPINWQDILKILKRYCQRITKIFPSYHQNIVKILPWYYIDIDKILAKYCQNIVKMLPIYCLDCAIMLLNIA